MRAGTLLLKRSRYANLKDNDGKENESKFLVKRVLGFVGVWL